MKSFDVALYGSESRVGTQVFLQVFCVECKSGVRRMLALCKYSSHQKEGRYTTDLHAMFGARLIGLQFDDSFLHRVLDVLRRFVAASAGQIFSDFDTAK